MATVALSSPIQQPHAEALALSQEAPHHLRKYTASRLPFPIPFLSPSESTELWTTYERVFLSCLRTGDDKSAFMCLEKLTERFGASNERVMGLRGLYQESVAENAPALEKILREYDGVLADDPTNTVRFERDDIYLHDAKLELYSQLRSEELRSYKRFPELSRRLKRWWNF